MFNSYQAIKFLEEMKTCHRVDFLENLVNKAQEDEVPLDPLERCIITGVSKKSVTSYELYGDYKELIDYVTSFEALPSEPSSMDKKEMMQLATTSEELEESNAKPELKQLLKHLCCSYLGKDSTFLVIIAAPLTIEEEERLINILRECKLALGWSISNTKGISPSIYMHKILMEDLYKPSIKHQR